ncbi:MAG: 7-cyano-7-deazaguanine synthase QueC, partial [Myxococcota bacterium]|nr:7-cyano-7-deazaguanine synthase QueC [Myxococcota bacterium]
MTGKPAIILLSGGLDSATALVIAREQGFAPHALSFCYGQRHTAEIDAARAVAAHLGVVEHRVVDIDLAQFGGSALTADIEVPKGRDEETIGDGIPITYVPARNTIFLSYALAWAEVLPARDLFIGVNAVDYSGYPDCRPEFIEAFETLANRATRAGVEGDRIAIHAPLMQWDKARIVREGRARGVDYGLTRSCYDPDGQGRA